MLVLDVVRGAQVHHVRATGLHELHAGGEDELRQARAVDVRHAHAHQVQHASDAVVGLGHGIGLFGGKTDALHALAQQAAQLVLGRHHGAALTRAGQRREDGGCAQPLRIVHHHLGAGSGVEQVVAADAVHAGRRARDDAQVVGIGEGGHHAVGDECGAFGQHARHPGHVAAKGGLGQVIGLAAVHTDDDDRGLGQPIAAAVDFKLRAGHEGTPKFAGQGYGAPLNDGRPAG